jgi:hypothetical protein
MAFVSGVVTVTNVATPVASQQAAPGATLLIFNAGTGGSHLRPADRRRRRRLHPRSRRSANLPRCPWMGQLRGSGRQTVRDLPERVSLGSIPTCLMMADDDRAGHSHGSRRAHAARANSGAEKRAAYAYKAEQP